MLKSLAGVALVSMTLVGCGDGTGGSDSSGSNESATTKAGVKEAKTRVLASRKAPTPLQIPQLPTPPKPGADVAVITCKLPDCSLAEPGFTEAAKALGWKLTIQRADLTPEAVVAAWTQAIADKPAAILALSVIPDEVVKAQMEEAEKQGIPVVMGATPLKLGQQGVDATIGSGPVWEGGARAQADWTIADSAGKAKIVYVYDPSYPLGVSAYKAARAEVEQLCSDCSIEGLKIQLTQAGNGIPGKVVSYLQRNPDVGYVLAPMPAVVLGVGAAIKSTGLPTKVVAANAGPANLAAVKNGTEAAAVTMETVSGSWRMVDIAARLLEAGKVPEALLNPDGALQIFDTSNIDTADLKNIWTVPDVSGTFAQAWRLGE
jgi:ABC-type sugar transport system substrate-binding protein